MHVGKSTPLPRPALLLPLDRWEPCVAGIAPACRWRGLPGQSQCSATAPARSAHTAAKHKHTSSTMTEGKLNSILLHTHTRLTALFPGLPRWASTTKVKPIWFYWSKRQWVAVASAGPYASLHLAPDRQPCQHPTTLFFLQAGCPFCQPTNSIKALKAKLW